jgi:mRNA-degrading endonuclease YafQ of YafQ-DinJ toxin-antitoxin module
VRIFWLRLLSRLRKHPDLIGQYEKALKLLEVNPQHPSLGIHPLKGKLKGHHFISLNITYRITIELLIHRKTIVPIHIGAHDEVYR